MLNIKCCYLSTENGVVNSLFILCIDASYDTIIAAKALGSVEPNAMGCVLGLRRYREALTRQSMYGLPAGAPLGPLYEFLAKVFPTEKNGSDDESKEEDLCVRRRKTVLEQLKEEEAKHRAGMAMFNEFERDASTDCDEKCCDDFEEEEEEYWEEGTSSDDRYSRD